MDYKIDFTDCEYSYNSILLKIQWHLFDKGIVLKTYLNGFNTRDTYTGTYIAHYNLHKKIAGINEVQDMILIYPMDKSTALLGVIMLRKLIEK